MASSQTLTASLASTGTPQFSDLALGKAKHLLSTFQPILKPSLCCLCVLAVSIAQGKCIACWTDHASLLSLFPCCCSVVYMVGTDEESFEWLDVNKAAEEVRILQDTVNVLDLPKPPEVGTQGIAVSHVQKPC